MRLQPSTTLGGQVYLFASLGNGLAHRCFAEASIIDIRRIDKVDTLIKGCMKNLLGSFWIKRLAPSSTYLPSPEAYLRD
jgi:hypothetical protein